MMNNFLDWLLQTLRKNPNFGSWLEESRFEWAPDTVNTINRLLNGTTLLLVTDKQRDWLGQYIMQNINHKKRDRPSLPIIDIRCILNDLDSIKTHMDLEIAKDLLHMTFPNGYMCWYIGERDNERFRLFESNEDGYAWYIDEDIHNKFHISPLDKMLDIKLLQFYKIFNKSINAVLFGEIIAK